MGWRYRKSLRFSPGVRLNISKRGISSVSFGRPGSTVNMGRRGVTSTIGIPGSGLSYRSRATGGSALLLGLIIGAIFGLFVHAARGSRPAQFALVVIALFGLFVFLNAPKAPEAQPTVAMAETTLPKQASQAQSSEPVSPERQSVKPSAPLVASITVSDPRHLATPTSPAPVSLPPTVDLLPTGDIKPTMVPAPVSVTGAGANIRSAPSGSARIVGQAQHGELLFKVGLQGHWVQVSRNGQLLGWIYGKLLSSASATDSTGERITCGDCGSAKSIEIGRQK
jgi:hypothetical protein